VPTHAYAMLDIKNVCVRLWKSNSILQKKLIQYFKFWINAYFRIRNYFYWRTRGVIWDGKETSPNVMSTTGQQLWRMHSIMTRKMPGILIMVCKMNRKPIEQKIFDLILNHYLKYQVCFGLISTRYTVFLMFRI
jgi:hypothetical protein